MLFQYKNDRIRYKFNALENHSAYFFNSEQKGKKCYTEERVIGMLEFLIDNMFVEFRGRLFQQMVRIPMGTNCAPLLVDLFLFSNELESYRHLSKQEDKTCHISHSDILLMFFLLTILSFLIEFH